MVRVAAAGALLLAPTGCDADAPSESPRPDAVAGGGLAAPATPQGAAEDCCSFGIGAGCSDVSVEACVCAADPYCCSTEWDSICVDEVESLACGRCSDPVACCTAIASPGCDVWPVEQCVCDADDFCCTDEWDSICVDLVSSLGCGSCEPTDLVIAELDTPPTACRGEDIGPLINMVVRNAGATDIDENITVSWYLSNDSTYDVTDALLSGGNDHIVGGLPAGAAGTLSLATNIISPTAAPGPRFLIARVDPSNWIAESDDLNNAAAVPIEITTACEGPADWLTSFGGTGTESLEDSGAVAVDDEGNVYVVGHVGSAGVTLGDDTHVVEGFGDVLVVSYTAGGAYRWSRRIGGPGLARAGGVATDGEGNVYVAVEAAGDVGALAPIGANDLLVVGFTGTGTQRWERRFGTPGTLMLVEDLSSNTDGELLVVGAAQGSVVDLGDGPVAIEGGHDGFVVGLDAAGGGPVASLDGGHRVGLGTGRHRGRVRGRSGGRRVRRRGRPRHRLAAERGSE